MKYIAKKTLTLIITLFIVSFLAFLAFSVIPGDPTAKILGMDASDAQLAALRLELGLDRPVTERYAAWITGIVRGDFGDSYIYRMPVSSMLKDKLPVTAVLTILSFCFTLIIAIPLGLWAGSVRSRLLDKINTALNQIFMSIPQFFIGIMLCYALGLGMKLFIPGNYVSYTQDVRSFLFYMLFPAFSIAIPRIAMTVKLLRGSVLNELTKDYCRTARSRGCSRRLVISRHVLKNAMLPIVTFLAVSMSEIMTGSIIVEQVFTVPGIGRLLLNSINNRDFPVIQAIIVIMAAWIVILNYIADVVNQLIDPRLRLRT